MISKYRSDYRTVAASQTDQVLGTGNRGDLLERLIVTVNTAATSTVSIKDGSAGSTINIMPANTGVGVYSIQIGARCSAASNPGWRVTTGAGVTVVAVGSFS